MFVAKPAVAIAESFEIAERLRSKISDLDRPPHMRVPRLGLEVRGTPDSPTRRTFASAKYAGRLILTAIFFIGVFVGGIFGRWVTTPKVGSRPRAGPLPHSLIHL